MADSGNNRIQKFDRDGKYFTQWGSRGNGNGQFNNPSGIAVDSLGNVYVADSGNNRIQKFAISDDTNTTTPLASKTPSQTSSTNALNFGIQYLITGIFITIAGGIIIHYILHK